MDIVFWICVYWILRSGNCLGHHMRHERTRYVSGKNQIHGIEHVPSADANQNYIPFVNFWERPLQALENSMNVPKKLPSRPLFSWDAPQRRTTTYPPTRKEEMTFENPIKSITTTTPTWLQSEESKSPGHELNNVTLLPPILTHTKRAERLHRAKDVVTYRTSYVHNSVPVKKRRMNNVKKSIDKNNQQRRKSGDGRNEAGRVIKVSTMRNLRRKKKGKKIKNGNGRGKKLKNQANEVSFKPTTQHLRKELETDMILRENNVVLMDELQTTQAPKSPCEMLEEKCEHKCQELNQTAVCQCFKGFTLRGNKCFDVNECEIDNGGCNGKCINTFGSRKCICSSGFRLVEGVCVDVNECLLRNGHGPCQDTCINTVGSYSCSCKGLPGTSLSEDNHTCEDKRECDPKSEGCSHFCVGISDSIFCTCPDGLELGDDWKTCHDIDECSNPEDYNVECESECINTIGSYSCATGSQTTPSE